MPRSAATAVRFDAGWDWTDPKSRADQQRDLAYYDWSLDEDFDAVRPRLRAVADPEPRERPRRRETVAADRPRPRRAERPQIEIDDRAYAELEDRAHAQLVDRPRRRPRAEERPRPRRLSGPAAVAGPRPVASAPVPAAPASEPEPASDVSRPDGLESPVIDPVTGRRTITITGRGAERGSVSRRPPALPTERVRHKPDRIAMWAVLLCVLMILAAATSAHAAMLH